MSKMDQILWKTEMTLKAMAVVMIAAVVVFPSINYMFM